MHFAVRADGSPEMGYGHLVRTGALAQKFLENGHRVTYLTRTPSGVSDVCPKEVGVYRLGENEVKDALARLDENEPEILLTDSYGVDTEYQRKLRESVPTLATVTDDVRFTLCCDVNINGNVYAPELDYDWIGDKPEMLLGTDYLLMREEFQRRAEKEPPWRDPPKRALVTFGGSDVNGVTPKAVRAFDGFELEIDVIIGPGFENEDEIEDAAAATDAEFNLLRDPDDLPRRMFEADFAVSATGSTVYELLATGTPVIGIPQAENQKLITDGLGNTILESSIAEIEGHISELVGEPNERQRLRKEGRQLIDGKGGRRVYEKLSNIISDTD
jgi:UDP-2,4-diacetamido-2,4,6-trideoxy-beta-L-altropyranose hydrolase